MKFTHTVSTDYKPSFRSESVAGIFDVPVQKKMTKTWEVNMPIENEEWEVGLIVGPSGSGKTTIAKVAFPDANFFDGSKHEGWSSPCFLDDFAQNKVVKKEGELVEEDMLVTDITNSISQVGFSSPPSWMLPFNCLSNGQKFRAEIARVILQTKPGDIAMVDEFTSVVDREVAKTCSFAVQKMIRRSGKKMVAISCHYDIVDHLLPDWIYHVDTGEFEITRGKLRRPPIEITLLRVHHSAWELFKGHHYLSADISKSAHCFVAMMNDTPVAFAASLPFPHPKVKNMWRGHRTVVLPDYQGIGIGNTVSEAVAQYHLDNGKRYTSVTSHPAMVSHRLRSKKWIMVRAPGMVPPNGKNGKLKSASNRMTASFEYIGDKRD